MIDFPSLIERQLYHEHTSDSHVEPDCKTFHPSSLSRCERQCVIQKLGLESHGVNTLMNFYLGTRQHEDLADWFDGMYPGVVFEEELEHRLPTRDNDILLRFRGRCDVLDTFEGVVYDFKTRKSWNGFDGAQDAHKDQLTTYMKMAGVSKGQLVYIVKSAPWDETQDIVKTWPENQYYEFETDRWNQVLERAERIATRLSEFKEEHDRLPDSRDEVPFEPCGCWLCESEHQEEQE